MTLTHTVREKHDGMDQMTEQTSETHSQATIILANTSQSVPVAIGWSVISSGTCARTWLSIVPSHSLAATSPIQARISANDRRGDMSLLLYILAGSLKDMCSDYNVVGWSAIDTWKDPSNGGATFSPPNTSIHAVDPGNGTIEHLSRRLSSG